MSEKKSSSSSRRFSQSTPSKDFDSPTFPFHTLTCDETLKVLSVRVSDGLSEKQIVANRLQFGKNEIPAPPGTSFFKLILSQFEDLLVLILLGAAVISFLLALFEDGEDRVTAFVEPAVILIILICNATVGVLQESNAEAAIEKLKQSEAREARVVRSGVSVTIPATELVRGDIVIVDTGDKVPADLRILSLSSAELQVEESMLTGESEATYKSLGEVKRADATNQQKSNILFSGTLVVRGKGMGVVVKVGSATEIGSIATDLSKAEDKTPLQEKLDEFGEQLSKVIAVICVLVWLMNIHHFNDPDHGSMLKGAIYYFKIAVALAVAAIPEGLPAVVTTCLALGTMKMAKKNAIVRSLPSVETLGCTTVICSDKTGTLTTNMMSVQKLQTVRSVGKKAGAVETNEYSVDGNSWDPRGSIRSEGKEVTSAVDSSLVEISKISSLCNEATLTYVTNLKDGTSTFSKTGAPTEAALLVLSEKIGTGDQKMDRSIHNENNNVKRCVAVRSYWESLFTRQHLLEFDNRRKSMSVICKENKTNKNYLFCKGTFSEVISRCNSVRLSDGSVVEITADISSDLRNQMEIYGAEGLRCLALSYIEKVDTKGKNLKDLDHYRDIESGMTFVGFSGMLDPPRDAVGPAIAKCRSAGIRVIVITGDQKSTAESICRRIGVFDDEEDLTGKSYTGQEFQSMSDAEKDKAVKRASLFCGVVPQHKLELVSRLKQQGEVVAMTGDGVNDSTALRQADIGIAMGSGTDVAKEASKMVLQDDNFATIVMAVEEGRAIYSNCKQFIRYLISSNIGEVACIFLTAAIGMPEALIPVQLLWVNLVTDGLPATALGFNPPDKDIMERAPRGRTEKIINGWLFFRYFVIGLYVGIGTVAGFIWWYLFYTNGPHISYQQLVNFHDCDLGPSDIFPKGFDCEMFHDPRPSTMSLSILVTIEMFNAMNALSENQSIFVVTPFSNMYVVIACGLSFLLHLMIVYIPFFSSIFHVAPLVQEEWMWVFYLSIPVLLIDEILKFISRIITETPTSVKQKAKGRKTSTSSASSSKKSSTGSKKRN